MSRKNFKVATDENNQTTLVKIKKSNVPTGKVITLEDKKKRKEAREKQYRDYRIAALIRRANRMGLSKTQTEEAKKRLIAQMNEPNTYLILLLYNGSIRDKDGKMNPLNKMVEQAILNNKLEWKMKSDSHMYIEGDQELLGKLREILPDEVKIHPYSKKKPPVLPTEEPPKAKKKPLSKAEKKAAAKSAKNARKKAIKEAHFNHKKHAEIRKAEHNKKKRRIEKQHKLFQKHAQKAKKKGSAKVIQVSNKKSSESLKKAA